MLEEVAVRRHVTPETIELTMTLPQIELAFFFARKDAARQAQAIQYGLMSAVKPTKE